MPDSLTDVLAGIRDQLDEATDADYNDFAACAETEADPMPFIALSTAVEFRQ